MPDLGALIADFLADAEASGLYPHERLRALRGNLSHVVASDLGFSTLPALTGREIDALMAQLRAAGVPAGRTDAIVAALRLVFAYAVGRGLLRSSPLVGRAPVDAQAPSPTTAMLELGRHAAVWTGRGIVIAFAVTVIGLILVLA